MKKQPIGNGFFIWRLDRIDMSRAIAALKRADAHWVCVKLAAGTRRYPPRMTDRAIRTRIEAFRAAGISVGGWQFLYTRNRAKPGLQAARIGERFQKFDIDFIFVDVEHVTSVGALWKTHPMRRADAETYCSQLRAAGIPRTRMVGLCSYRFPHAHREVPYSAFLRSPSINAVAPQVYWQGAHNPAEQLRNSLAQYDDWARKFSEYVPIGATYGEHGWRPTAAEIVEFRETAEALKREGYNINAVGWWELGYILSHPKCNAWLDAIAGNLTPPPPQTETPTACRVKSRGMLRIRTGATTSAKIIGGLYPGAVVPVRAQHMDGLGRTWYDITAGWVAGWLTNPIYGGNGQKTA